MNTLMNWVRYRPKIALTLLIVLSLALHFHVLNYDLMGTHAWRQCETASTIVNYTTHGMEFLSPRVYHLDFPDGVKRMEFPIFQYVGAILQQVFGDSVVVLRLYCFSIMAVGLVGFARLGRWVWNDTFWGIAGAWLLAWSPLFYYYMVNPMPDILALSAGIWAVANFAKWRKTAQLSALRAGVACLTLSALCKLPFITFIGLPLGWIAGDILSGKKWNVKASIIVLTSVIPPTAWTIAFIDEWKHNGVVGGILSSEMKDIPQLVGIFLDHLSPTLPELIVNYAATGFFVAGVFFLFKNKLRKNADWLGYAAWAVSVAAYYLYEINMIGTAHDYYLMPFLPGLFIITTYGLKQWLGGQQWVKTTAIVALVILPITAGLRINSRWEEQDRSIIVHKEALRNAIPSNAKCMVGHDISPHIYLYHMATKGWSINAENIAKPAIDRWLKNGAEFLICDDRGIESHEHIAQYLGDQMTEIGPFKIWKLNNPYLNHE